MWMSISASVSRYSVATIMVIHIIIIIITKSTITSQNTTTNTGHIMATMIMAINGITNVIITGATAGITATAATTATGINLSALLGKKRVHRQTGEP